MNFITICFFQVHSLTARSVPRYFREGLKNSRPKQPNRNIPFSHQLESDAGSQEQTGVHSHRITVNGQDMMKSDQIHQQLPSIPQEQHFTPMSSTYYNFTKQVSGPTALSPTLSMDHFHDQSNFTKVFQSQTTTNILNGNHLPGHKSKEFNNSHPSTCCSRKVPSKEQVLTQGPHQRDPSPDHLGIPGGYATLVPNYRVSHFVPGDTSDESSTSTCSPPRYSRRPLRTTGTPR